MDDLKTPMPLRKLEMPPFAQQRTQSDGRATAMAKRAKFLIGQFKGSPDFADPVVYMTSLAAILAEYPDEVVLKATDPRTGIARAQNWHPTPHELSKFCDKLYDPIAREAERQKRITSPDRLLAAPAPAPRKTLAELQAACERNGGLVPRDRRGSPVPKELSKEEKAKLLADLEERAKAPSGIKASPELLAKLAEERT